MTTYITDFMSLRDLNEHIEQKFVNAQNHPELPLIIYNYTGLAMLRNQWNNVTEHCRGLIVEESTGKIIARGPKKFYNVGQSGANEYHRGTDVTVTRKEDGSLGICWEYAGNYGVATRGSFTSDQAIHATKKINTSEYEWLRNATYCGTDISTPIVEIVAPFNRIVLDYGDRDELIPLGEVGPEGLIWSRAITGSRILDVVGHMTYGEALSLPIPNDEEGYVVDILGMEGVVIDHLKLKGDEYLRRHRIISQLSEKSIWESLVEGNYEDMLKEIPDEFLEWCNCVAETLRLRKDTLVLKSALEFEEYKHLTNDRKAFAQEASKSPYRPYLFLLLDNRYDKIHDRAWNDVKPKFDDPIVKITEEEEYANY